MDQHDDLQPNPLKNNDPSDTPAEQHADVHPDDALRAGAPPADSPRADPGAPGADGANADPEPATVSQWFAQNGLLLVIVGGIVAFLATNYRMDQVLKMAVGLSLVIFIHELGHFLVAKWCDVHVTTFSIGFGPALPGCSYTWGETTYKLALFPLGGYVQMVGQVDGDEASDGSEDDPRSYRNKSVGQRMAIISAGVIMNVILAIVCFIVVYLGPGKDRQAAVVAVVEPDSPSFRSGVRTGSEILQIGIVHDPHFEDLMRRVMATGADQTIKFRAKRPGDSEILDVDLVPRKGEDDLRPMIGISPSSKLQLATRQYTRPSWDAPVEPWSPAALAEPKFEFGDWIIGTSDPADPAKVKALPRDPRFPEGEQCDYFEFSRRMQMLAGKDVIIQVRRTKDEQSETVNIKVPPAFHYSLGVRMQMGPITAIRNDSPADLAGIHARDKKSDEKADQIVGVTVKDAKGKATTFEGDTLDPLRLPYQLKQWSNALDRAKFEGKRIVTIELLRVRAGQGPKHAKEKVDVEWNTDWRFDKVLPMGPSSPWAIPELGLAYLVTNSVASVDAKGPAAGILQPWDAIQQVRVTTKNAKGKDEATDWAKVPNEKQWAYIYYGMLGSGTVVPVSKVEMKIMRNNKVVEVTVVPAEDQNWPVASRGLLLMRDTRIQRADGIIDAISLGISDTHSYMMQVFETLHGIFTNRQSVKLLGGPLSIGAAAYRISGTSFGEFVFFLGLISVNLAVINFLPIPVLDGGHMVFLIYEGIRGKPASEGVRVGATYIGLALILSLMVFVFYLDITRLF